MLVKDGLMEAGLKVTIFLVLIALFSLVVGILELLIHGLIVSSWYCILIAGLAVFLLYFLIIGAERFSWLWVRSFIFTIYLLLLSILFRISSSILFGGVANIIIVFAITLFVVAILFIGTFSSGKSRRIYHR